MINFFLPNSEYFPQKTMESYLRSICAQCTPCINAKNATSFRLPAIAQMTTLVLYSTPHPLLLSTRYLGTYRSTSEILLTYIEMMLMTSDRSLQLWFKLQFLIELERFFGEACKDLITNAKVDANTSKT